MGRKRQAKGDEREGSRLYGRVDEGCRGWDAKGNDRMGGWKRSKPPSPDGERRENEDGGLRSMTPINVVVINVRGTRHRNPDTLNATYDDDHEDERSDVWRTYPINSVGTPVERRESRCYRARERGHRWHDFREEKESALQISSRGDKGDRERERENADENS